MVPGRYLHAYFAPISGSHCNQIGGLQLDSGSPCVAIEAHRRFGPVAGKYATVRACFLAQAGGYAIVPMDLFRNLVCLRAAKPSVSQERILPTNKQEICNVLKWVGQLARVTSAAA